MVYLIVIVSTKAAAFPTISIVMIAAVYGLQAVIFIVKREFMLVGWMVVYILSYALLYYPAQGGTHTPLQVSYLQFPATGLFILVHG